MALYAQVVVSGLLVGGLYALLAVGLTLIFGVMKVVNFAHGDYLMVGMYLVFFMYTGFGVNPYLTIPVTVIVLFLMGVVTQKLFIERTLNIGHSMQMVVTLGIALILQSLALMLLGGDYRSIPNLEGISPSFKALGLTISTTRLISFVIAVITTGLLMVFLNRTRIGKAMRATAQNSTVASLCGIPVKRIYLLAMGIGTALVGVTASVLAPIFSVYPTFSVNIMLLGFVVVVLGGLGNVPGAFVGGLIIGVVEAVGSMLFGGTIGRMIYFLLFLAILVFRPQGLFRGEA
jgi:branched-chain amino acid transport system permease protein